MLKIEHTEVLGWEHAIRGMRNPMNSWEKSDSWYTTDDGTPDHPNVHIGLNDLDLMKRLRNAGTDHRKFMRMIAVYVDITAPLYWWKEFDTYKVGTVANSCSTIPSLKDIPISNEIMEEAKRRVHEELNTQWDKFYEMHSGHENDERAVFRIRKEDVDPETWDTLMKATQEGKSFHIFEEGKPFEVVPIKEDC